MQTRNAKQKSLNREIHKGSRQGKTQQKREISKKVNETINQQQQSQKEQNLQQFFDIEYAQGLQIDKQYNLKALIKWDGYDKSEITLEPYENIGKIENFWCIQNIIQNLSYFKQYGKAQCQGDTLYMDDQQYIIGQYKQQKQNQQQKQQQKLIEEVQQEQQIQQEQVIVKIESTSRDNVKQKKSQLRNSTKQKAQVGNIKQELDSNQENQEQQFFVKIETTSVRQNLIDKQTSRELRFLARNSKKQELLDNINIKQEVIREKYEEISSSEYVAENQIEEEQKSARSLISVQMDPQVRKKSNNQQEIIKRLLSLDGTKLHDYLQMKFKYFLLKSKKIASMNLLNRYGEKQQQLYFKLLDQNMVILNKIECKNGYGIIPGDKAIFIASHKINIIKDRKSGNLQMKLMFELEFGNDESGKKLKNNFAKPYKLYKSQRQLFLQYIEHHKEDLGFMPEMFKKYRDQKKYISLKLRASRKIFYEALKSRQ